MFHFWDFDKKPELIAIFRGQYKSVGAFKKNVYYFKKTKDDKAGVHIWGLVQINNLFYGVPFGTKIKLTYLGMKPMPDSGRMFKDFNLEILSAPDEDEDITTPNVREK